MRDLSFLRHNHKLKRLRIFDWKFFEFIGNVNALQNLRYIFLLCQQIKSIIALHECKKTRRINLINYPPTLNIFPLYNNKRLNYFIHIFSFDDPNMSETVHPLYNLIYVHIFGCTKTHIRHMHNKTQRISYYNLIASRYPPTLYTSESTCKCCSLPLEKTTVIAASCSTNLSLITSFVDQYSLTMVVCPMLHTVVNMLWGEFIYGFVCCVMFYNYYNSMMIW